MSLSNEPGIPFDQRSSPLLSADVENQAGVDVVGEVKAKTDDTTASQTGLELPPWRPSTGSSSTAKQRGSLATTSGTGRASTTSGRGSISSVRGGDRIGENVEVDIICSAKEWGAGLGLDSSDESSSDEEDRRRKNRRGAPSKPERAFEGDTPRDEVGIVEVSGEWAGGLDMSDSDEDSGSDSERKQEKPDRRRCDFAVESMSSSTSSSTTRRPGNDVRTSSFRFTLPRMTSKLARFVVVACLSIVDFPLQFCCLLIYAFQPNRPSRTIYFLIPIQLLGICLSTYITFHDRDIIDFIDTQKKKHPNCHKFTLAFLFLAGGCCHLIQVKRAYRRQIKTAEIVTAMDDDDDDFGTVNAAGLAHFGGAERAIPVALLTGVPFLLVNTIAFLTANRLWDGSMRIVLISASCVSLLTVSLGIIEIDLAVSTYVCKRYHFECRRTTWAFPFVHVLFRAAEVSLRVFFFTAYWLNLEKLGREWIVMCFALDYLVGFVVLQAFSASQERPLTHVIMAFLFLVADLSHFVDQPNFAIPARRISRILTSWRLFEMIALLVVSYLRPAWSQMCMDEVCEGHPGRSKRAWMFEMQSLAIAFALYCILIVSPPIWHVGHDLHSAAKRGDVKRLAKLLKPDSSNQVLDVNATTKDGTDMSPLHFAAAGGHVEAVQELLSNGADVTKLNNDGDNCLHVAARNCRDQRYVDTIKTIASSRSRRRALNVLNKANKYPRDFLAEKWRDSLKAQLDIDMTLDRSSSRHTSLLGSKLSMSGPAGGHENVPIVECANVQLKGLFPNAEDDDAPSPRALNSVSGLIFSKAAGGMARKVLKRNDDAGMVSLGALRKVGELGKGGFGKVIEVVMPDRTGGYFSRENREKRYALKLQTKTGSAAVQQSAFHEVLALRTVRHPFIVLLEKAFATPKFFALLLELCPTDLNRKLCELEDKDTERCVGLGAYDTARYLGQTLIAIRHMHKINIVYRDLKPENILVSLEDEAKVADFGLAKAVGSADRMTMCGTMGFFPPELLNGDLISDSEDEEASSPAKSEGCSVNISNSSRKAASRMAQSARSSSIRSSRTGGGSSFDPFKLDSYSYGVTLQVCLLGEDGAQKKEIRKKGAMMLPMHLSEDENKEMLTTLRDNGRLSPEAYDLLVNKLLPFRPKLRSRLLDGVDEHPFFLKNLNCNNLHDHLLKKR